MSGSRLGATPSPEKVGDELLHAVVLPTLGQLVKRPPAALERQPRALTQEVEAPGEAVWTFDGPDPATAAPLGSGVVAEYNDRYALLLHANLGETLIEHARIRSVLREGAR